MYGDGFRLNGQFTSSLARDTPGEAPSRSTSWRLNGSSFGPSAAGQESLHAHADALPFGQIARQPADGEVENAETEGAEDRHAVRTLPGRSCAAEDNCICRQGVVKGLQLQRGPGQCPNPRDAPRCLLIPEARWL